MNRFLIATVAALQFAVCADLSHGQSTPPLFEWAKLATGSVLPRKVQMDELGNAVLSGFLNSNTKVSSTEFTNELANGFSLVVGSGGNPVSSFQSTGNGPMQMIALPLSAGRTGYFGGFSGTVTMGSITRSKTSPGIQNIFYAFADPSGQISTFDFADGDGFDNILDAALTPEGNIVVYGMFSSAHLQFGGTTLTNFTSPGSYDLLIATFYNDGQLKWVRSYPSDGDQFSDRLAIDEAGNIFITGAFQGVTGGSFSLGNTTLTNGAGFDVFVAKLSPDGEPIWAISKDWSGSDWSGGISLNKSGDLFVAASAGRNTFYQQMRLIKFSSDGELNWQFASPTNLISSGRAVKVGYDGEAYVCGQYDGYGAVWKFDNQGRLDWLKTINGTKGQTFLDLDVDGTGALTVLGYTPGTNVVVDGSVFTNPNYAVGDYPLFFARLAADPPLLRFQNSGTDFIVSWPTNQPAFQLEANDLSFGPSGWLPVEFGAAGLRYYATNQLDQAGRVFRLRKATSQ